MEKKAPTSITVSKKGLQGGAFPLMLTKAQSNKLEKAKMEGKGCGVRLSPRQMKESYAVSEQMGTGFFKDASKWLKKNIPKAVKAVAPVVKPLVKPAVGALANKASPGASQYSDMVLGQFGLGAGGCAMCPACSGTGLLKMAMPGMGYSGNGMSPLGTGLGDSTTDNQQALF